MVFKWLSKKQYQSSYSEQSCTTGAKSAINQSEFQAITCYLPKVWEKSRVQDLIGFGFASHWLKNWREIFKPITCFRCSNLVLFFPWILCHFRAIMADAETVGPTRSVLEPLHLALHVARSLSPWYHKIPDIDVVGKLDAVKVCLAFLLRFVE